MNRKTKVFLICLILVVVSSLAIAQKIDYSYPNDPWVDRVLSLNQSGESLIVDNITINDEICIGSDCKTAWPTGASSETVMTIYILNSMTKDVLWNISFAEEESYTFTVIGGSDIHPIKGEIT